MFINFLYIFAKNEQSNLVLVLVLILESKGPYWLTAKFVLGILFAMIFIWKIWASAVAICDLIVALGSKHQ